MENQVANIHLVLGEVHFNKTETTYRRISARKA